MHSTNVVMSLNINKIESPFGIICVKSTSYHSAPSYSKTEATLSLNVVITTLKMYAHTLYVLGLCIQIHERQHGHSTCAQCSGLRSKIVLK